MLVKETMFLLKPMTCSLEDLETSGKIDSIAYQMYYSEGGAWPNSQTLSPKLVAISLQNLARAVDAVLL